MSFSISYTPNVNRCSLIIAKPIESFHFFILYRLRYDRNASVIGKSENTVVLVLVAEKMALHRNYREVNAFKNDTCCLAAITLAKSLK